MVIDQNTTHMNDFSKGMNTDISDAFIEKSLYRLANNLRYITNTEENSGELHMIEGAQLLTFLKGGTVLAATQLRDLGIIVAKNSYIERNNVRIPDNNDGNNWQVWTITNGSNRLRLVADIKNGDGVHEKDRVIGAKKLSLVTKWEDDDNGKLYIADGLGPIISIPLIPKQTMVDNRIADVIPTSLDKIVAYPAVNFGVPKFCGLIDGNLKAGMYEYSYQFYVKNGPLTEISPSTKLIPLHNGGLKIDGSVKGYESGAKTDKGIKIRIPLDTEHKYDRLKIYRICYEEVGVPPIIGVIFDEVIEASIGDTESTVVTTARARDKQGHEYKRDEENVDPIYHHYYDEPGEMPFVTWPPILEDSDDQHDKPIPIFDLPIDDGVPHPPISENTYVANDPDGSYHEFCDTGKDLLSIITLEEYNMMTGIHIIPKTIESMTDYMFASNIKSDNPIYDNEEWNPDGNISWEFVTTTLLGDYNNKEDKITITGVNDFYNIVDQYNLNKFIGGEVDTNSSYANPFVSYCLKSLRREETYRYGIILYDKWGNTTAVKHIGDIVVPNTINGVQTFETRNNRLVVHPVGILFTVNNLPDWVKGYEIVRCGKDASNMSTLMQCAISRPISKVYDVDLPEGTEYKQSTKSTFTPTGYVTNMDVMFGADYGQKRVEIGGHFENTYNGSTLSSTWVPTYDYVYLTPIYDNILSSVNNQRNKYIASNSTVNTYDDSNKPINIVGNEKIFQIISPEYCYQSETVKDMLYKNLLYILPISYIHPNKNYKYEISFTGVGADGVYDEQNMPMYNIGNKYANAHIITPQVQLGSGNDKVLYVNTAHNTLAEYYIPANTTNANLSSGEDFKRDWKESDDNRFAYIKLYNRIDDINTSQIEIKSTGFPLTLGWDDFATVAENWQPTYVDKITSVGGRSFCNWVAGGLYGITKTEDGPDAKYDNDSLADTNSAGGIMGPGGKCMVIAVENSNLAKVPGDVIMGTYLCNIKQAGGGYSEDAKYSTYRSYGNYFSSDDTKVYVFDGDCFIQPFEYISQHKWAHPYLDNHRDAMIVYSIPMETSINLAYTHGYEFSKNKDAGSGNLTLIQTNPSNVNNALIQDTPLYAYNSVYSANSTSKTKIAEGSADDDWFDRDLDYRVYNSVAKANDEFVDNWLKFLPANFLDVDTRYGEITGLRKFNNTLVFWQEMASGILSVNERVLITDDANMPLTLGTADVLSRYDYMNTSNGMKADEYADTLSDTTLYWWDHNKHEILGYSGGTLVVSVSKSKQVLNLLNRMYSADWLIDNPVLWHDKKFNEVVFGVSDGENEYKGSLVFGENVGAFTALYTVLPTAAITFKDSTLLINSKGGIYKWNSLSGMVCGIDNLNKLYPYIKYVVNPNSVYTKTFDNVEFGGYIYGGSKTINWDASERIHEPDIRQVESRTYSDGRMSINYPDIAVPNPMNNISFTFTTPLKLKGVITGDKIDNTEYNFRFAIPRDQGSTLPDTHTYSGGYGGRLKGKTMLAELRSTSSEYDFSLQYILTKYRISWS